MPINSEVGKYILTIKVAYGEEQPINNPVAFPIKLGLALSQLRTGNSQDFLTTLNILQSSRYRIPSRKREDIFSAVEEKIDKLSPRGKNIVKFVIALDQAAPFDSNRETKAEFMNRIDQIILNTISTDKSSFKTFSDVLKSDFLNLVESDYSDQVQNFNFYRNISTYRNELVHNRNILINLNANLNLHRSLSPIQQYVELLVIYKFATSGKYYVDSGVLKHLLYGTDYFSAIPDDIKQEFESTIMSFQSPQLDYTKGKLEAHGLIPTNRVSEASDMVTYADIFSENLVNRFNYDNWDQRFKRVLKNILNKKEIEIPILGDDGREITKIIAFAVEENRLLQVNIAFNDGKYLSFLVDGTFITGFNMQELNKIPGGVEKVRKMVETSLGLIEASFNPSIRRIPLSPPQPNKIPQPIQEPKTRAQREEEKEAERRAQLERHEEAERLRRQAGDNNRPQPSPVVDEQVYSADQTPKKSEQQQIRELVGDRVFEELREEFDTDRPTFYGILEKYFNGLMHSEKFINNLKGYIKYSTKDGEYRVITIFLDGIGEVVVDVYLKQGDGGSQHIQRSGKWPGRVDKIRKYYKSKNQDS